MAEQLQPVTQQCHPGGKKEHGEEESVEVLEPLGRPRTRGRTTAVSSCAAGGRNLIVVLDSRTQPLCALIHDALPAPGPPKRAILLIRIAWLPISRRSRAPDSRPER